MKMFLIQILDAYPIFDELTKQRYSDFKVSYKIAEGYKQISEKVKFYTDEERKLVNVYAKKNKDGSVAIRDGNIIDFEKPEDGEKYRIEIMKLQGTSFEMFDPIEIKMSDLKDSNLNLTPKQLLLLHDLVKFKMED